MPEERDSFDGKGLLIRRNRKIALCFNGKLHIHLNDPRYFFNAKPTPKKNKTKLGRSWLCLRDKYFKKVLTCLNFSRSPF